MHWIFELLFLYTTIANVQCCTNIPSGADLSECVSACPLGDSIVLTDRGPVLLPLFRDRCQGSGMIGDKMTATCADEHHHIHFMQNEVLVADSELNEIYMECTSAGWLFDEKNGSVQVVSGGDKKLDCLGDCQPACTLDGLIVEGTGPKVSKQHGDHCPDSAEEADLLIVTCPVVQQITFVGDGKPDFTHEVPSFPLRCVPDVGWILSEIEQDVATVNGGQRKLNCVDGPLAALGQALGQGG